ncbi:TRAP transporter large permease [Shumkonia mesophila]|uniref:TRAP transporter large permease n=1 Tax=Shumkonia mesophila TaxID=2838854 RepID=UPI0029352A66|nr:TRAP transporter large permease [Shumkonia mesophila]
MISLVSMVLFIAFIIVGVPIGAAMGLAAALVIVVGDLPFSVIAQRIVNALDSDSLLAVPLFIFAANLFDASGITTHIFNFTKILVGKIRGGLGYVTILANLIFSGISGAALADIGGLGAVQIRMMREQGYRDEFSSGITMAAATIGPIFPPSIPLIIYATAAEVSSIKLLIAGVVPALVIAAFLMLEVALMARFRGLPRAENLGESRWQVAKIAFPALLAPIILIGGLISGLFGPTEVAAITALYGAFLGRVVYRKLDWANLIEAARKTVLATASVLFIVGCAAIFAWVFTIEQVPIKVSELLLSVSANPLVLLAIVNIALLVIGMVMESIAAILILAPILAPALAMVGVDPIQLGVVVVLNLMIGLLTPPVGMSLYMVAVVADMPVERVLRGSLPFLIPLLLSLVVVTMVPAITTWLPNVVL